MQGPYVNGRHSLQKQGETMTSKYTIEKIAEFADGRSNSAIQPDVRDLVARHLLDSIGCAIGAMSAKVTQDIKAVVDVFGAIRCAPSSLSRSSR
jgi:2-methylcitrate dehydratase PrpD